MPDRENAIKGLESIKETLETMRDKQGVAWVDNAITLLRHEVSAQEPRVMTLEDMWALKFNDIIIIEQNITPLLFPAIVIDNIKRDCNLEVLQVVTASMNRIANADYDYYGKAWRCWTSRPTDAQREAIPWMT